MGLDSMLDDGDEFSGAVGWSVRMVVVVVVVMVMVMVLVTLTVLERLWW